MDNDNNTKKMWGLYTKTPHASTSHHFKTKKSQLFPALI